MGYFFFPQGRMTHFFFRISDRVDFLSNINWFYKFFLRQKTMTHFFSGFFENRLFAF